MNIKKLEALDAFIQNPTKESWKAVIDSGAAVCGSFNCTHGCPMVSSTQFWCLLRTDPEPPPQTPLAEKYVKAIEFREILRARTGL